MNKIICALLGVPLGMLAGGFLGLVILPALFEDASGLAGVLLGPPIGGPLGLLGGLALGIVLDRRLGTPLRAPMLLGTVAGAVFGWNIAIRIWNIADGMAFSHFVAAWLGAISGCAATGMLVPLWRKWQGASASAENLQAPAKPSRLSRKGGIALYSVVGIAIVMGVWLGWHPVHKYRQQELLWESCMFGEVGSVRSALANGADAGQAVRGSNGMTPLMLAAGCANPFFKTVEQPEPVMEDRAAAVYVNYPTIAELLLKYGADVDARDDEGCTALFCAASIGHEGVARVLVEHGATVNITTASGATPLAVAQASRVLSPERFDKVIALLNAAAEKEAASTVRRIDRIP